MITERSRFKFLHSWDYYQIMKNSSEGGLPKLHFTSDKEPFILDTDGNQIVLVVSDYMPRGAGLQDNPNERMKKLALERGENPPWL